jgi:hypothetical protein
MDLSTAGQDTALRVRTSAEFVSIVPPPSKRGFFGMGLEGIVSKRRDDRSGRCPEWIKLKNPNGPAVTRVLE